jgi:hypothetical protein
MTANIHVILTDLKNNTILLDDTGRNAGLEVAGKVDDVLVS